MIHLPLAAWIGLGIIAFLMLLGVLHAAATAIRGELFLHDLRVRVNILRNEKLERLRLVAEQRGPHAVIEVGEVGEKSMAA